MDSKLEEGGPKALLAGPLKKELYFFWRLPLVMISWIRYLPLVLGEKQNFKSDTEFNIWPDIWENIFGRQNIRIPNLISVRILDIKKVIHSHDYPISISHKGSLTKKVFF